ncbi:hypothetical protein N9C86_00160 [Schleiferiaceae bacterium]|nr:hypothetical protein [Schleiferiaceae bacterium]
MKAVKYKGSALAYIRNVILPSLPPVQHLVQASRNLSKYLQDDSRYRIIRKTKGFNLRGLVHSSDNRLIVPSDNEAALYVYMESFVNNSINYVEEIDNFRMPIAFAMTKDEKSKSPEYITIGRRKRESQFGQLGWKLCHIFQCSPNKSMKGLNPDERMMRLLNPMNHFPFPSPRRFQMPCDYGEDENFINLVIHTLWSEYYIEDADKIEFLDFIQKSNSLFPSLVEDFQIEIDAKIQGSSATDRKRKVQEKSIYKKVETISGSFNKENVEVSKNFMLKKTWYGKGLVIVVPALGLQYDHDLVVKENQQILGPGGSANRSWESYSCYTNSRSYPSWAADFIRPINEIP